MFSFGEFVKFLSKNVFILEVNFCNIFLLLSYICLYHILNLYTGKGSKVQGIGFQG